MLFLTDTFGKESLIESIGDFVNKFITKTPNIIVIDRKDTYSTTKGEYFPELKSFFIYEENITKDSKKQYYAEMFYIMLHETAHSIQGENNYYEDTELDADFRAYSLLVNNKENIQIAFANIGGFDFINTCVLKLLKHRYSLVMSTEVFSSIFK